MAITVCSYCNIQLEKDTVALNKKLLGRQTKQFLCLKCLAKHMEASECELLEKIQYFKEEGCGLFG